MGVMEGSTTANDIDDDQRHQRPERLHASRRCRQRSCPVVRQRPWQPRYPCTRWRGPSVRRRSGTNRMSVAVASAQKPPTATPSAARAIINIVKLNASAISTSETIISPVNLIKYVTTIEARAHARDKQSWSIRQTGPRSKWPDRPFRVSRGDRQRWVSEG